LTGNPVSEERAVETATEQPPSASPTSMPSPPPPPSPSPPSPTPQPITPGPVIAADFNPTPGVDIEDLAPYRQAMLPEFANDVDIVAAAGVSRYYLEIDLSLSTTDDDRLNSQLRGVEQVRYTNTEEVALSEIYFRLYPNLPGYGGQLIVDQVVVNDQIVEPELEAGNSALRVPLPEPLAPDATIELELTYQADIPARGAGYNIFSHTDDTIALAGFYPAIAVYDDEGWNVEVPPSYGDATYLDVALYQVELTVPEEMVVAASGSLIENRANSNDTKTLHLASGPMRDFYLALRADYQAVSEIVDGTVVTSYYPPDLQAGGLLALRYAADSLRVFNERFGQYPYAEFDIVATPTTAGGVEYPGIVVVSQRIYNGIGGFFQHATVHEVAHQWWYGVVGNDQVDEPWLDEALTNYSTILYWEEIEGPEVADEVIENLFLGPYEAAKNQGLDRAVAGPVADFSEGEYGVFVYGKGPLFFDALRQEVGQETFLAIMQTYYAEYKYQIAQPDDLLAIIERVSKKEVGSLFEQWIQQPPE
jgi:hypothetical protein